MSTQDKFINRKITRKKFLKTAGKLGLATFTLGIFNYQPKIAWADEEDLSKVVPIASNNPSIVWIKSECEYCEKCVKVCKDKQTVLGYYDNSDGKIICVNCGQCAMVCPEKAIIERDHTARVWQALNDSNIHVVVQTAPATRVSLGELFDMDEGTNVEGKQVTALRQLGFDGVFDTPCTADLTIMEEATELVKRLKKEITAPLPQFTSCSPGWVSFCEYFYHNFIPNLSTAKSPQQMMGTLVKTYYAQKKGLDPAKIFTVAIMPCTAKKYECQRPEMNDSGIEAGNSSIRDLDAVLTTRELAKMIKDKKIDFKNLKNSSYDTLLGESTGAGVIFGSSGGVMEAAVRTAYYLLTNQDPPSTLLTWTAVRGLNGVKEASVDIPGFGKLDVAVCQGLGNGRKALDQIKAGTKKWHYVEFMGCRGGCVGGGGQPKDGDDGTSDETLKKRSDSLYKIDSNKPKRLSYKNEEVKKLYQDFLGSPMSAKAKKLLHTEYTAR
ncbi:MAG: [FeFe] hydrogenase, group A [Bacillota bacterium]